jgi:8-oxo-dGTP diphosphatase
MRSAGQVREHREVSMHVVGVAIVCDGRVLAARRARPPDLAGGWEFPGGKVERGESEPAALVRECREELGVVVQVGARLGEVVVEPIRLVVYAAGLLRGAPQPGADHDQLRWLAAAELDDVPWLPIDRALLPVVAVLL